ncbi:FtsH protease activity modulator HflK [Roseomonas mucosa]|uniref:FtsH protease activity modulator HflK n=1 Tax=Roseomonas mucosa TaxID=207340 RepID=UPI0028CF3F56|nr:FtsH protease activity modulator HflK [Roseomonas mucosa]MDT8354474.1 FtsH protease activity modulator HflK [Roseomonas mucosa]
MPWNSNGGPNPWGNPRPPSGGGNGNNQGNGPGNGPWGQPPRGGGGNGPFGRGPDLDDVIRQAQDAARRFLPRGGGGGKGIALIGLALVAVWAASGIYRVQPDEQGVVMRFGAFRATTGPGLNYHLPWPIESVTTPRVTRINRIDIGFRSSADNSATNVRSNPSRNVSEESMMLTGDENIIDIDFAVFWRIRDAGEFLFNTRNPEQTVKSAAESMMREVIGRTPIQPALTEARAQIEQAVRQGTQAIMDQYGAGVEITQVQMQKVDPPPSVVDAFRDVQRAQADRERARNEAESYRNDIIPRARGDSEKLIQSAQADREAQVARAKGEAQRFTSVLTAYRTAQDITLRRMYLETMQEILQNNPKVIVDENVGGVLPLLNLDGPGAPRPGAPRAPGQNGSSNGSAPAPNPPSGGSTPGLTSNLVQQGGSR